MKISHRKLVLQFFYLNFNAKINQFDKRRAFIIIARCAVGSAPPVIDNQLATKLIKLNVEM